MRALIVLITFVHIIFVNGTTNCDWTSYSSNEPLYPAGICQITSDEAGTVTSSMNTCNQDASLTINDYSTSDCTGDPTTSTQLTQQGDSTTGQPIYWQCNARVPCDYFAITRYNPDSTCQDVTGDSYYFTFQLVLNLCFYESTGVYQHYTCDENDILTQTLYSDSVCSSGALTSTNTFSGGTSCDMSRGYYIFGGCVQSSSSETTISPTEIPSGSPTTYTTSPTEMPSGSPTDSTGTPSKMPTTNTYAPTQGTMSPAMSPTSVTNAPTTSPLDSNPNTAQMFSCIFIIVFSLYIAINVN